MEFGNFKVIFFYDLGVHFDIWNNLRKKFFFKNFQNRRGDHYDFDAKCTKILSCRSKLHARTITAATLQSDSKTALVHT